jgi:hypothetical protein
MKSICDPDRQELTLGLSFLSYAPNQERVTNDSLKQRDNIVTNFAVFG